MKAQKVRSLLKQEITSLYKKYDVLIAPTMPVLPFRFGEKIDDPLKMYSVDVDTGTCKSYWYTCDISTQLDLARVFL